METDRRNLTEKHGARSRLLVFLCLMVTNVFLSACTAGSKGAAGPVTTTLSQVDQTDSTFIFQLFALNSGSQEGVYAGTVVRGTNGFEFPPALDAYFASFTGSPQPIQYFIKAYSPSKSGTNGDFYYESPVFAKNVYFNGPSTVLSTILRSSNSAHATPLYLNATTWQNLLFLLQTANAQIGQSPAGQIFNQITSNAPLQNQINALLASVGAYSIDWAFSIQGRLLMAYCTPALSYSSLTQYVGSLSGAQGAVINAQVVYVSNSNFTTRVTPDSWGITLAATPETTLSGSVNANSITYAFDYQHTGSQIITAHKQFNSVNYSASFSFTVATTLLPPVFNPPSVMTFQSNHQKVYNLGALASDPRNETVTLSIVSVPSGATLLNGNFTWNPPELPVGQTLSAFADILATNQDGNTTEQSIPISVQYDNHPAFSPAPPTNWNLSEGSTSSLPFTAADADGDPVEVVCLSGCNQLLSGFPAAAGWPDLNYLTSTIYSGVAGAESILIPFMPSYLQTLVVPQTVQIVLGLNYPISNSTLRQISSPSQQTINLNFTNIADPPVWSVQPTSAPSPQPTELTAMNMIPGGTANDPTYNPGPHVLTYSFSNLAGTPGSAANCSWLVMDPATGNVTGTPYYQSSGICSYQVRATDALGLYADSSTVVSIHITDVPQGVSAAGTIPTQTATENILFKMTLGSYFNDLDATAGDPRETLTYTCLTTCGGLPTTGNNPISLANGVFSWTPPYATAPTNGSKTYSNIQIQVTNKGGFTAVQTFNLTVNYATTPMAVAFASNSLAVSTTGSGATTLYSTGLTAGNSGTVTLQVGNIAGDTSSYPYTVNAVCSPNCSANLSTVSGASGAGPANFTLTLAPTIADGYAGGASDSSIKTISVTVTDTATPSVTVSGTVRVQVNTVDRVLTGISMNADTSGSAFAFPIDASVYKSYQINLKALGPDSANDSFTYAMVGAGYGAISGTIWQFNPASLGCPGTGGTVNVAFVIKANSSHGSTPQTVSRTVNLTLTNTQAGQGNGCPY